MSYNAIYESIFTLLQQDPSLIPGILGPKTVTNLRLYRAWPQMQSFLATYEPQPPEGWLVVEEPQPGLRAAQLQYDSDHEMIEVTFHVFATAYAIAHATMDVLDSYLMWTVEQQREVLWGDRWLLFTRRFQQHDAYAQATKLYQKDLMYRMELVREVALADPGMA